MYIIKHETVNTRYLNSHWIKKISVMITSMVNKTQSLTKCKRNPFQSYHTVTSIVYYSLVRFCHAMHRGECWMIRVRLCDIYLQNVRGTNRSKRCSDFLFIHDAMNAVRFRSLRHTLSDECDMYFLGDDSLVKLDGCHNKDKGHVLHCEYYGGEIY